MDIGRSICRTCRKEDNVVSYLSVEVEAFSGKTVADMIYEISDILVRLEPHLPQIICEICMVQLRAAHNFRQQCIESNALLAELHGKPLEGVVPAAGASESKPKPEDYSVMVKMEKFDDSMDDQDDQSTEKDMDPLTPAKRHKIQPGRQKRIRTPNDHKDQTATETPSRRPKKLRNYSAIAKHYIAQIDDSWHCRIDEFQNCKYGQKNYDAGNFIRHFRIMHPEASQALGLAKHYVTTSTKKKRAVAKRQVAIDSPSFLEGCIKLVTVHNLPLRCFDWAGLRMLMDPISESIGFNINGHNITTHLRAASTGIVDRLKKELAGRTVSVKVDVASRNGRHVLSVCVQYEFSHEVVTRTLGLIEVRENQSSSYIKSKILEVLLSYDLVIDQIFTVVLDNGPNMIANSKKLKKTFAESMLTNDFTDAEIDCNGSAAEEELIESLSKELNELFRVVRGAVHTLQLALNEAVPESDPNVKEITQFVMNVRQQKYQHVFDSKNASYPPLWSTRWSGKYKMIKSIVKQEPFFKALCEQFPELSLRESDWQFLKDYDSAFLPLHSMVKLMQKHHQPFSEFYMQWLVAIKDVRTLKTNRFAKPLITALTKRLGSLKEDNLVFKAALYLDPRFNYLNSAVFTFEQKDEIQNFIVGVWNRIGSLHPSGSSSQVQRPETVSSENENEMDMDDFLTEMFGGTLNQSSKATLSAPPPLLQQLKTLEIDPRQPHNYDVWNHWILRKSTHPELFAVAMIVLAAPSNQISVKRAFSALMVSDRRPEIPEALLGDIFVLKQNQEIFEKVVATLYDWKKFQENVTGQ